MHGSRASSPTARYDAWRGRAFEYVCHRHSHLLAKVLGFAAVKYDCGSWFSRAHGGQIDLLFRRADRTVSMCEMKFHDAPVGVDVIPAMERKRAALPNPKRWTVETALVTASAPTADLVREGYFTRIVTLDDLFG